MTPGKVAVARVAAVLNDLAVGRVEPSAEPEQVDPSGFKVAWAFPPGSKRYAGGEDEHAEILGRHLTVLAELLARDGTGAEPELLVVTASWSDGPAPAPREAELAAVLPAAEHWTSILTDGSGPGEETWTHLWASAVPFPGQGLARLLRLVASYATAGVIITTAGMSWLYHPYDGGADVIAATAGQRDQLRREHQDWLSAHPSGL